MNTSILALNLDKSCVQTTSLKSKEHLDHFKKLFEEIHTFCKRNHDLMVERLKEEELRSKDTSPDDDDDDGAERPTNAADNGGEHLPVVPDVVDVAPDIFYPENRTDCPENFSRLKYRKISLTCKESVDNLELLERIANMPRLEEGEEISVRGDGEKKIEAVPNVAQVSPVSPLSDIASTTIPIENGQVSHSTPTRPASLPVTPVVAASAMRLGHRRFSVSKVDSTKKQNSPIDIKPAALIARRATVDCVPNEMEEKSFHAVRRLVADMVNFCAYEAGELANTPIIPAHHNCLSPFETSNNDPASSSSSMSTVQPPPSSESLVEVSSDVEHLVDDLVRFVDYETKHPSSSKVIKVKKSSIAKKAPVDVVDRANRNVSGADYERETEISLAVREVVRDLVKSVSVQLDRKTAGRSSLIIRNRQSDTASDRKISLSSSSSSMVTKTKPSTDDEYTLI